MAIAGIVVSDWATDPVGDPRGWHSCGRKRTYRTRQAAKLAAQRTNASNGGDAYPSEEYRCRRCGFYHVGRNWLKFGVAS